MISVALLEVAGHRIGGGTGPPHPALACGNQVLVGSAPVDAAQLVALVSAGDCGNGSHSLASVPKQQLAVVAHTCNLFPALWLEHDVANGALVPLQADCQARVL